MTAEILIFIVVLCLVATSAGQLRTICLLIFLTDYQWGPAGANHGPLVWWAEENKEVLVAWHQLFAGVLTAAGAGVVRTTFWIWEFMKMLKPQGCQMELYMSLSSGHRHWAFSGRSTSVSTEREGSICNMWTARESCANQEELSAVRNAAHLLQSSVEAH